jgi:hypothetical protein
MNHPYHLLVGEIRVWHFKSQTNVEYNPWMRFVPEYTIFVNEVQWKESYR